MQCFAIMVVSPFIPFPNISWWAATLHNDALLLDKAEHYEKMTFRNKYTISGSNGIIQLSIPLQNGRNQRATMKDIKIAPEKWQVNHWRTITSVYARSPFFEFYADILQQVFDTPFIYLIDFNLATLTLLNRILKAQLNISFTDTYNKIYDDAIDIRSKEFKLTNSEAFPSYYQVFADRTGFIPNLSILDLLFSEGPNTLQWLAQNKEMILQATS